jgi:pimeloyl-ACP methyl ester carboxylesterase
VPENWDAPDGRKIDLKLALLASTAAAPPADPVVLIAGGPGQAATEAWPQATSSFAAMREKRNMIVLDQRGTGGSNALTCARSGDESESAYDLDRVRAETKACLDKVSAHADPRFYTTTMALRDLEALREALGKPRFNLVGVSYGTRVAQQYAKTYPDAVRSVILDSAVPNDNVLGSDFAGNLDAALKAQFAVCAADAKCAKAFGDPWANLEKLRAGLREKSVEVSYRDPVDNAQKTMRVGPETLAALARMYAYMPETGALLPLGIARAVAGDYAPLAGQAQMLGMQMKSLADNAMQLSVICSEDADRLAARESDAGTLLGAKFVDVLKAQCGIWPHGTRPADFNAPLTGDVPVLILGGEFDPVTPPRYAEAIVKTLPKGRVLIAKGKVTACSAAAASRSSPRVSSTRATRSRSTPIASGFLADSGLHRFQRSRAMIEVTDLHKQFGSVRAVDNVSFTARDGEITGLLGPNGAGKTTTLRMLYTLMKPDRGSVRVDGIDAAADPLAVRRRLGVLPDARGLYKRLSARENIDYFGRLQGLDAATRAGASRSCRKRSTWATSSNAAPKASRRASASRPRSRARSSTSRRTSSSTNRPTAST